MTGQEESLGTELEERVGIKLTLQRKFCPTTWSRTEMGAKEGGPEGSLASSEAGLSAVLTLGLGERPLVSVAHYVNSKGEATLRGKIETAPRAVTST